MLISFDMLVSFDILIPFDIFIPSDMFISADMVLLLLRNAVLYAFANLNRVLTQPHSGR
jgi:hypothetical protein